MFGKHYCTGGQGGMVFSKGRDIYQCARWASDRGKPFGLPAGASNCIASLNFNLDEIGSTIGRVQLKKLPGIVARRRETADKLGKGLAKLKSVAMPEPLAGTEPSCWFLRLLLDTSKLTCTKEEFCRALSAEGLPVSADYSHMPHTFDWYKNRRVFGTSGYPWASPDYKGDTAREFPCPNALAAIRSSFILYANEGWGGKEVADAIEILMRVESAYLK
jgi:dTDP-4-amino-4,6-dideoxygalactose transaminase